MTTVDDNVNTEEEVTHGQIEQLPTHIKAIINEWLLPLNELPGLLVQAKDGNVDPVLAMLQRLSASEGYSPTDGRLEPILRWQAERFVEDMKALKNKATCYMALLSMYIEQVDKHDLYIYVGCDSVEEYCINHVNMSKNFLREVQQIGEYCRTLRKMGLPLHKIFEINLDKVTYSSVKGLQNLMDRKIDEGIIQKAQVTYPHIVEAAQEEVESKPIPNARGREGQIEQAALAQKILEKLPVPERKELSESAFAATQIYAQNQLETIISQPPNALLYNMQQAKGELPKEKARLVLRGTYDAVTNELVVMGRTRVTHEMGLHATRGQMEILFDINEESGEVKISGFGEYVTACTNPSEVPSTLANPSREF